MALILECPVLSCLRMDEPDLWSLYLGIHLHNCWRAKSIFPLICRYRNVLTVPEQSYSRQVL